LERYGLTVREGEVLRLIADGRSNPAIAEALYISPRTAQTHVQNIFTKLGVNSRAEAVRLAVKCGLV
jgi:DNA-binding CsgD family transcriptional regulator